MSILANLFLTLILGFSQTTDPAKAFVKDKNVHVAFTNGTSKQLTFNDSDRDPFLLPDNTILFIREFEVMGAHSNYKIHKIMTVDIKTLLEHVITDRKPYEDGNDGSTEMLVVERPVLSLDKKYIYFLADKYVTGNELVKVEIASGTWTECFPALDYELVDRGPFKGMFFAAVRDYGPNGPDTFFRMLDEKGTVKKEFANRQAMAKFRNEMVK
jgi:hypothetical protein